jgi:hypothetical protein
LFAIELRFFGHKQDLGDFNQDRASFFFMKFYGVRAQLIIKSSPSIARETNDSLEHRKRCEMLGWQESALPSSDNEVGELSDFGETTSRNFGRPRKSECRIDLR